MLKRSSAVVAVLALVGGAYGVETMPAGTQGAGGVVNDFSEPKKAVLSFLSAVQGTDMGAIQNAIVTTPEQAGTVETYVKLILATNKLEKAAEGKFGAQADQYFGINSKQFASRVKSVQDAEVRTTGNSAVIEIKADEATHQPGGTLVVKKNGAEWKLDGGSLFRLNDVPQEQAESTAAVAGKMIPVTEQMTKEIEEGKFASAGDAYQVFWNRSLEVARAGAGAATQGK